MQDAMISEQPALSGLHKLQCLRHACAQMRRNMRGKLHRDARTSRHCHHGILCRLQLAHNFRKLLRVASAIGSTAHSIHCFISRHHHLHHIQCSGVADSGEQIPRCRLTGIDDGLLHKMKAVVFHEETAGGSKVLHRCALQTIDMLGHVYINKAVAASDTSWYISIGKKLDGVQDADTYLLERYTHPEYEVCNLTVFLQPLVHVLWRDLVRLMVIVQHNFES
jgi:hypothetical protein